MKLQKFSASNMREALALVKAELGSEAMIVATRPIRRGILGQGIEVTASLDGPSEPLIQGTVANLTGAASGAGARTGPGCGPGPGCGCGPGPGSGPVPGPVPGLRSGTGPAAALVRERMAGGALPSSPRSSDESPGARSHERLDGLSTSPRSRGSAQETESFTQDERNFFDKGERSELAERSEPALSEEAMYRAMAPLRGELRALTAHLRPLLVRNTRTALATAQAAEEALRRTAAAHTLTAPSSAPRVALIGPTGVGKTTTIAKLAARDALIHRKNVAVVTIDTYRVGGEDQIRTFAELIGIPLVVVRDQNDLPQALESLTGYDRVFIDTPGRSPRDVRALNELSSLLSSIDDVELHLAISAGSTSAAVEAWAERFGHARLDRLLFTKVDEADELTALVTSPAELELPASYFTTGQRVPEDIEEATDQRLLDLALHGLTNTEEAA